ncbi:DnaJ domain protein [Aspergillus fischeri NRRL 181]|uniref:DnaJ domain protein n=1 Tax=Neosartorya fischeri (strain ATCC 1020 / DSM 3700 / CBS 544.65 / FGSC A1164 / JCM 1740 / NRRL 181 / WB 181) TaxID=331117 RepID=A1CXT6_NEOFI|nr:DnaJ domain protein [Aspergillus fischeri NRRL 181]EAW25438.1 DnaJ domain protein [Aspergillus fischeri NRRL 181]
MPSPRVRAFTPFILNASWQPSIHRTRACTASFSTTTSALYAAGREPTLYEILDVPVTASAAEIKKKFYSLSLHHHPDRNPGDPKASSRFARISSAYHVLSNSAKRSAYDREHGIYAQHGSSTHSTANPGQHPMGSHSSYGANLHTKGASYAGSRPASGLSKRRGPFRGPPPSFYAHGGYGSSRRPPPGGASASSSSAGAAGSAGDEDPTSFIDRNSVYHFNARGHYRTQSAEDARRQERRSREMSALNEQYIGRAGDFALRFVIVCGILLGAGAMTGWLRWPTTKSGSSSRRKEG